LDVLEIPFVKHVGIEKDSELKLNVRDELKNHIQTIHASAQFTLAETASGACLMEEFPQYKEEVIPMLRSSTVKYKSPATSMLRAKATLTKEAKEKFLRQFEGRGQGVIAVEVELFNEESLMTMEGEFVWFVARK
jgi:Putative thioesterase (yiiD_Cterm).